MIRADPTHLSKAMDLMLRLYEIDPDMQLTEILVFLHVAIKNGDEAQISTGDFASIFGMTNSSASRNSYYWAEGNPESKRGGHNLAIATLYPTYDPERHLYYPCNSTERALSRVQYNGVAISN